MDLSDFRCYLVNRDEQKQVSNSIARQGIDDLFPGEVLIRVAYSSLNYKDALAATGHPGVVRNFPHVPGIDAAGTVEHSGVPEFAAGDKVLVTGFDLGAASWGGYSEFVRVPAGWVVPLPKGLTLRESMIFGTAGFTAAESISALRLNEVNADSGEVLVTGASGGVGSMAVAMLTKLGYQVVAATGKSSGRELVETLGASRVIGREEVVDTSSRPLLSAKWAGAVDTVGGAILTTAVRSTQTGGCVTACGMVAGSDLSMGVFPFILRGITLAGIDSATYPIERRPALWAQMAGPWRPKDLEKLVAETVTLDSLNPAIEKILNAQIAGRVLVEVAGE